MPAHPLTTIEPTIHSPESFGLPPSYPTLSPAERLSARLSLLTTQTTPHSLVAAWSFFRTFYLRPLPEGMWYAPPYCESPPAHYRFVYCIARYSRNALAFPRSFGKSKILKELLLLFALTRPRYTALLVKSRDSFVSYDFKELMLQISENPYILHDFGLLRPRRGHGAWSASHIWLTNGFQLIGRSVQGQLLGLRPRFVAFDDVEYDPLMQISPTVLTENFKSLYFNHVRPMLDAGSSALILGTLLNRKSFLYHLCTVPEADEPRIAFFNRAVVGAYAEDGTPTYPTKWSETTLSTLKREMGNAAFDTQLLNRPSSDSERFLRLQEPHCYYSITDQTGSPLPPSSLLTGSPHSLPATYQLRSTITAADGTHTTIMRPFTETLSSMYRILLADPIRVPSITSDYACVLVIGVERSPIYNDVWWLLDLRLGRVTEPVFLDWCWELGHRWRTRYIGIESVSIQHKITERAHSRFADRLIATQAEWSPVIYPIKYKGDFSNSKASRISGLAWRFDTNRIRLPHALINQHPFSDLLTQIHDFTQDLTLLQYDDAIDTLAMAQFLTKPATTASGGPAPTDTHDVMALLAAGETYFPGTRIPLLASVNACELTPAAVAGLSNARFKLKEAALKEAQRHQRTNRGRRRLITKRRPLT